MRFICFMLLLTGSQLAVADIYKWVDAEGNVHYGDRPGASNEAEQLQLEQPTLDTDLGGERSDKREKLLEVMREDREALEEKRRQQQAERKKRMKLCSDLKKNYQRFRNASAVYKKDKDGNRDYFSQQQREKTEQRFRKRIRQTCGKGG